MARAPTPWLTTRAQIALAACACAGASAFLYAVDPARHAVYPQCLLYNATGYYCAGCGATRAIHALLHGRVIEALHDNALFVAALPFLAGFAGWSLWQTWQKNAWPEWRFPRATAAWSGAGIFLLLTVFTILRNLPGWPFAWLRPISR